MASSGRSILASVVGWIIVAIVAYFVFNAVVGTVFWLIRTALVVLLVFGLVMLYFKLKTPSA